MVLWPQDTQRTFVDNRDDIALQSLRLGLSIVAHAGEASLALNLNKSGEADTVIFEMACLMILFTDLCRPRQRPSVGTVALSVTVNTLLSMFENQGRWKEVDELLSLKKNFSDVRSERSRRAIYPPRPQGLTILLPFYQLSDTFDPRRMFPSMELTQQERSLIMRMIVGRKNHEAAVFGPQETGILVELIEAKVIVKTPLSSGGPAKGRRRTWPRKIS